MDHAFLNHSFIADQYEKENHRVESLKNDGEYCVIYFSSNGIYFPNTEETFLNTIVKRDKYEWFNPLNRIRKSGLNIWVRDIHKQWYVKGINARINSVDGLKDHLAGLVGKRKVITVGSSSGGYAAVLLGILLKAEHIFSFSGQFSLCLDCLSDPLVSDFKKEERSRYYDLKDLIKGSAAQIFYFYTHKVGEDQRQAEHIKDCSNVHTFNIAYEHHGITPFLFDLPKILNMSQRGLLKMHTTAHNKVFTREGFSIRYFGMVRFVVYRIKELCHSLFKKVFLKRGMKDVF